MDNRMDIDDVWCDEITSTEIGLSTFNSSLLSQIEEYDTNGEFAFLVHLNSEIAEMRVDGEHLFDPLSDLDQDEVETDLLKNDDESYLNQLEPGTNPNDWIFANLPVGEDINTQLLELKHNISMAGINTIPESIRREAIDRLNEMIETISKEEIDLFNKNKFDRGEDIE